MTHKRRTPIEAKRHELLLIAWREFMMYCFTEPDILLRYERATGERVLQSGPDKLGDVATATRFMLWATKSYWGEVDVPDSYLRLAAVVVLYSRIPNGRRVQP